MLPDIFQHLGPKQLSILKDIMKSAGDKKEEEKKGPAKEDEDQLPELKQNFEDVSNQVDWPDVKFGDGEGQIIKTENKNKEAKIKILWFNCKQRLSQRVYRLYFSCA